MVIKQGTNKEISSPVNTKVPGTIKKKNPADQTSSLVELVLNHVSNALSDVAVSSREFPQSLQYTSPSSTSAPQSEQYSGTPHSFNIVMEILFVS